MAFEETRWSLVLRAGALDDESRSALETLCGQYWPPLYSFLRAKGLKRDDAADVLQGFFAHVLEKNVIEHADPAIGRFRTYLLTVLTRFAANEYAKNKAVKRGGRVQLVPIDGAAAEALYSSVASGTSTPEEIYERKWAISVLNLALERLENAYRTAGKRELFDALKPTLIAGDELDSYAKTAERLDMSEGAVRVAVHRLKTRFRDALLEVVADTVESPDEVESEVQDLFAILGRPVNRL
jgi:RNA polymerase sigma-70 factor (ECF subfamily)